jgi:hypothetical protein
MPEKSGMDAAPCALAGTTGCPKAGIAAAAKATDNQKVRRCTFIISSRSSFARAYPVPSVAGTRRE